jgi:hypothetical protein
MRVVPTALAALLACAARGEDARTCVPEVDPAAALAPGCERVVLRGGLLVRGAVREAEGVLEVAGPEGLTWWVDVREVERRVPAQAAFPLAEQSSRVFLRSGPVGRVRLAAEVTGGLVGQREGESALRFLPDVLHVEGPRAPLGLRAPALPRETAMADVRVVAPRGRVLEGTLCGRSEEVWLVDAPALGRVAVVRGAAADVRFVGARPAALDRPQGWFVDPSAGRTGAVPTALLGRPRTVTASQVGPVTQVEAIPLPHLAVAVGTAWETQLTPDVGANGHLTLRAALPLGRWVTVGGGALGALSSTGGGALFLFGVATFGTPEAHLSLYVGPPSPGSAAAGEFGDRVGSIEALWRPNRHVALLTEHWVGLDGEPEVANLVGARLLGRLGALDLGLLRVPSRSAPLPWLAVSLGPWGGRP